MKREVELLRSPPRLVETEHPYAEILAQGNLEFSTSAEESERFYRTRAGTSPRPRRGAMLLAPIAVAAAVVLALVLGALVRSPVVSKGVTPSESLPKAPATLAKSPAPIGTVAAEAGVELAVGEQKLHDGSIVDLIEGGSARVKGRGKATSVVLDRGKVSLAVERRSEGAELEVAAGAYRFRVIGTKFSVTRAGDTVELRVDEGRVAVFGETGQLATVSAGGDWSSAESAPSEPVPSATAARARAPEPEITPKADATSAPDCRELARAGEPRKAEACYLARSSGAGLDAETALLEVARLRRDVLGDSPGALRALESYRQRFPNGTLRQEADIAHVVLLTRLGRSDEALVESQRLLDSDQGRERAFELRMLRGNVYKKSGNPALAAREFAKADALAGASPEATYSLATCLEELGDTQGAAAAYRRYLEKSPSGKRAREVRERLGRLSP